MTRTTWLCTAAVLVVLGCGRDGDRAERAADTLTANAGRTADSMATAAGNAVGTSGGTLGADEVDIEGLELGRAVGTDGKISDETDDFRPTDQIIAVVETDDNESGKELVARWTYGDNEQVVSEQRETVTTGAEARTQFKLTKQGAWPVGKYHLRILSGGKEVKSKEFEVKAN